uniref:C-factor n=1 Tax=Caenorhabditis tropicalis TaxID=1561998 RepID=A0A1I7UT35_9PELO
MVSSPKSVIVTGANRGIGLTIVKELVKDSGIKTLIVTARDPKTATDLHSIKDPRIHILPLEVTSDESIDRFVDQVKKIVGDDGLNCLINNAGAAFHYTTNSTPSRSLLTEQFDVNTVSVVILTQKLLPLLRKSASRSTGDHLSISRSAILNISSGLASIADNTFGSTTAVPMLAYAMSKTAINQFTKMLSIDLKKDHILAVCFEPGWIKTNLGGPMAQFTLEEAIPTLVETFYKLNESHNGGYFYRDLKPLPY